ncbi:mycothiol synthase [Brachybacterium vulturis]|uniref:Mycothiol acetyltransferase n=1 Tax=Brachybacterium vulturis TaxID=2017484 RepID=A0A291GLJ9_9MICO|nr:mycothiol synthase [Brachybacterium vulturis]ATG51085.1 mycothiol synthase [Brachybacterium vulturis]
MITTAALPPTRRTMIRALLTTVTEHDGASPLDEAALLALDGESAQHLLVEEAGDLLGYASVLADGTVQGMVDPAHRRRGHGTALLHEALALRPDAGVWAHGALEGSLAFLSAAGLAESRYLLTLHRELAPATPLPAIPTSTLEGLRLGTFAAERDAERWVSVNARAFADHPEQGAMTGEDLAQRLAQPWFDAEDMLVALRDEELVGFVWVKREHPGATDQDAEIYVVATDPSVQGHGVAGLLLATSLDRLRADGVPGVELYVEADNAPALRLYEAWGFTVAGRDVQMRATGRG